jgi:hypothetical protein
LRLAILLPQAFALFHAKTFTAKLGILVPLYVLRYVTLHVYPTKSNRVDRLTVLFVGTTEKKSKFKIQGLIMVLAKKVLKYKRQIVFEKNATFPFANLVPKQLSLLPTWQKDK